MRNVPAPPRTQRPRLESSGSRASRPKQRTKLGRLLSAVQPGVVVEQVAQGLPRTLDAQPVAAPGGGDHGADQAGVVLHQAGARAEDQLRIVGGAVVVDAKLSNGNAHLAQRHALGVPEGGCRVDAPGGQGGDGVEADRDPVHGLGVGPVRLQHRVEDRIVGGKAGHSHRSALKVTRPADVDRIDQHRRQRALHDRRDPHHVEAALPRQAQVVDVQDRELGAARLEQLRGVGRRRWLLYPQVDPRVAVVAALESRIDAGVHGVGLEIEDEGRFARSARFSTIPATAGDARRCEDGRQQRGDPSHRGGQDSLRSMAQHGDDLLAYVEIPKGSRNKYEYDQELGQLVLDRFLSSSTVYPTDYGYLVGHLGRDGDPLDALVCVSEPTFPGCVIRVKPIALFKMHDEKGVDDKIVCVPLNDPGWNHAERLEDIPKQLQREISHFFSIYKQLEDKKVAVEGWRSREEALAVIEDGKSLQERADREGG